MNALETKILELIGESTDSPDVFTDDDEGIAQIRDSINDAIAEILMLTGGFKRQYFLPLREDTGFYRIALQNGELGWIADVWSVNLGYRLEQTDLGRLTAYDPRWMVTSAPPRAYLPIGQDIIGFYPKPSASSDVMELTVIEIPTAYTSDRDRIKLRQSFQYATVQYAVAEFWASRGDAQEAAAHMQLYTDALHIGVTYEQIMRGRSFQTSKDPWPSQTQ